MVDNRGGRAGVNKRRRNSKISPAKVFIDTAKKVDVSQVFWLNGESTFYKESPIDVHRKLRGRD